MPERRMKSPWIMPAVFTPFLIWIPLLLGAPIAIGSIFLGVLFALPAWFAFRRNGGHRILRNPVVLCHGCERLRVDGIEDPPTGADRRSAIRSLERLCWMHLGAVFFTILFLLMGGTQASGSLITTMAIIVALFLSLLFMTQCLIAFLPTPGRWWTRLIIPRRPVEE